MRRCGARPRVCTYVEEGSLPLLCSHQLRVVGIRKGRPNSLVGAWENLKQFRVAFLITELASHTSLSWELIGGYQVAGSCTYTTCDCVRGACLVCLPHGLPRCYHRFVLLQIRNVSMRFNAGCHVHACETCPSGLGQQTGDLIWNRYTYKCIYISMVPERLPNADRECDSMLPLSPETPCIQPIAYIYCTC